MLGVLRPFNNIVEELGSRFDNILGKVSSEGQGLKGEFLVAHRLDFRLHPRLLFG
jgi:hypothetical protein